LTLTVLTGYSLQNAAGSTYFSILIYDILNITSPPIILQNGTAGTSTIYTNNTSAKASAEAPLFDYVDNNDPDVDSSGDVGIHSNFTAQQAGPDSIYDTLSEGTKEVIEDYVDNEDSDVDGSADQGTLTDFANLTAFDSNYANFSESAGEDNEYSVDLTGDYLISDSADMTSATGTIEMWVQFDAVSGRFYGLDGNMETRYSAGWVFDWGGTGSMTSSHTPSATTWYHYSWTWDETANDLFFYVGTESTAPSLDAGSPASGSWTGTVSTLSFTNVYIGNGKGGTGIIDGHFDDVRYWSDVRTLTEIQENYNKTLEGNEAGLVNYWKLENDLTDSTGTDDLTTSGASYAFSTDVPSNWESDTDYLFDHEVQFTSVTDFLVIEKLCIYAGSFGGLEDINVTYWGGSSWSSITSDLTASSWNNYTVSLTSTNFTIKFGGSSTTGDSVQDYWLIDAVLLQVSGPGSSEIAVDNDTSDADTSGDEGSLTDFDNMKSYNSSYANFTETISGADIEFVNSTETVAASGDLVVNVPDGVQDGDFMISFLGHSHDDPAVTLTPASGWTLQRNKTDMGTRAVSPPVIWIYYRVANSSEPSSYTWQFSTAGAMIGFCLAYRNVDAIDIDSLNAQTSTGGTAISPDISTNNDGDWIISFVWHDDDDPPDMTAPSDSGFTALHDAQDATGGNGFGMGVGHELRATQGSTGTRTWTLTASEERSGIMLSINASGTGNYTLDQEVQFTNVPTILPNATLCIYANSTDAEDIAVDVWNVSGSSWYEVFSDLTASAWNNVSIVNYLTSENFTVRFRDGNQTGDTTTQDTWLINVALVHIWNGIETNYQLDVEVQWTSAAYTRTNEELCIKAGTFSGSEDIQVKIWNSTGSSWHWVMNLTTNQWNNVSITSYLTSNTLTVQFLGGTETGDTTQDNWNIDTTLLRVWNNESSWLSGWDNRVKITINHIDIDSDLSAFPVLVHLSNSSGRNNEDTTFVFDEVGSNSKKIALTESDGTTQCYVEIEKWNATSEDAWLWTKVPDINSTANTDLYLYYDSSQSDNTGYVGDVGSTTAQNVWDSSFKGVWHLSEVSGGAGSIKDSTLNNNNGTDNGSPTFGATGMIDSAIDFDGLDDYINITNSVSLQFNSSITVEAWINLDSFGSGSDVDIALRKGEGNPNDYQLAIHDQKLALMIEENDDAGLESNTNLTSTTWYYLSGTWNGSIRKVYLNGTEDNSGSKTETITSDTRDIYIGGRSGTDLSTGIIDEVRVSNVSRSAAWIKASYESGRDDLLDFGASGTSEGTYDYVLRVNNTGTDSWQIRLKKYGDSNIGRLQNCTIHFYNSLYSTSRQIYIENGIYINQTGPWFDLVSSETIYIVMTVKATSVGTSQIHSYLELRNSGSTTYAQFVVTFEVA
jgi:hypothetical protein